MDLNVSVDSEVCIGTGNCAFNAPAVFEQDEVSGVAHVVDAAGAPEERILFAADTCPVQAIRVSHEPG